MAKLPLIPTGDHGTIPAALRGCKQELFPLGKCDEDGRPGTGSRLYYISSWAMCWPTDHPKKPVTGCFECSPSLQLAKSASGTLGAHFVLSKWYTNAYYMQIFAILFAHFIFIVCRLCKYFVHTLCRL